MPFSHNHSDDSEPLDPESLATAIRARGRQLGFQQIGISDIDLSATEPRLIQWLADGFHGEMAYMERHGTRRSRPAELLPGTIRVICARMDYLPPETETWPVLHDPRLGYISRYALGRDYHKLLRKRLQRLADHVTELAGAHRYRAFTDSAPVMEKPLAQKAGLGWQGKHSNLINSRAGSWFFLGEIYTDLPLPVDAREPDHCGHCHACIDACPTGAIVAPYTVDARRCISYLTIELKGSIPEEFRPLIGNRIYGCDDCQLVCPWTRFSEPSAETDFRARSGLAAPRLVELFSWDEEEFPRQTEGSAIRRIGHEQWLRNIAIALGNAPPDPRVIAALEQRRDHPSALVREHVAWALRRHLQA